MLIISAFRVLDVQKKHAFICVTSSFDVYYKGERLENKYIADYVCYNKIVVELKAVDNLLPIHTAQVINYLAITGYKLGLLVNFNTRVIKPERIVRF